MIRVIRCGVALFLHYLLMFIAVFTWPEKHRSPTNLLFEFVLHSKYPRKWTIIQFFRFAMRIANHLSCFWPSRVMKSFVKIYSTLKPERSCPQIVSLALKRDNWLNSKQPKTGLYRTLWRIYPTQNWTINHIDARTMLLKSEISNASFLRVPLYLFL